VRSSPTLWNWQRPTPGVFAKAGASLFAAFKPMGLSDTAIDEVVKAFGRLKTAEENFDFDQFRLNMAQMFGQKFEMQDMKQALTFFPRFAELLSKQMGLATTDLDSLQKHLKAMQDSGVLTFENFATAIADSVNNDKNFGLLEETLGNRFKKMAEQVEIAIAPLGSAIADRIEPAIAKLVGYVEQLSKKFQALPRSTQNTILKLGGLAAIIGPLIAGLASLLGVIGFIAKGISFLVAPIVKAGGIMAAWTKVIAFLGTTLGTIFSIATAKVIAIILALVAVAYLAYKSFQENWGYIGDIVTDVYNRIASSLSGAINTIFNVFWYFNKAAIQEAIANILTIVGVILNVFSPVWAFLGQVVMGAWDLISIAFKGIWQVISSVVMFIVNLIRLDFASAFTELGNIVIGVANIFLALPATILRFINAFVKAIATIPVIGGVFDWLGDKIDFAIDTMVDGIPMMESSAQDLATSIGDGFEIGAEESKDKINQSVLGLVSAAQKPLISYQDNVRKVLVDSTNNINSSFLDLEDAWENGTQQVQNRMQVYGNVIGQLGVYAAQALKANNEAELAGALKAYRDLIESELKKPFNISEMRVALEKELQSINSALEYAVQVGDAQLGQMGIFTMPLTNMASTEANWNALGTNARVQLIMGFNPVSGFSAGQLMGANLANGFTAGLSGVLNTADDKKKDLVKPPPGAKAGGKKTAQDFFGGFVEALDMLKASPNASLAGLFDVKQMQGLLKGKSGQMVVDFLTPILNESAKLKESATYLDLFNQRVAKLRETASPQLKSLLDGFGESLKLFQGTKDDAKKAEDFADAIEKLKDKLKDFQGQLAGEKSVQQALEDFIGDPANKIDLASDAVKRLIAELRGAAKELDIKKANEGVAEIMERVNANIAEFQQAQADANKELQGFIDLGKPAQTNLQQLETFLAAAALKGYPFAEAMLAAARASATNADALALQKTRLSELGINLKATISPVQKLNEILMDSTGLKVLAADLGITVEKLKELIIEAHNANAAIKDLVKPKTDGSGQVEALQGWDVFFQRIRTGMDKLKADMPSFEQALGDAVVNFTQGVGDVFYNAVKEWDGTWKGFWDSLKKGFAELVREFAAQMMRLLVMQALIGAFGGGAGASGGGSGGAGFGVMGGGAGGSGGYLLAAGGLVRGPGTGVSDSIPAMLSNGEYVIPAQSVKHFGVGFFDQLRNMRMPVGQAASKQPMPSVANVSNNNTSSSVMNNNINITVPPNAPAGVTTTVIQREVMAALQKSQRRNR